MATTAGASLHSMKNLLKSIPKDAEVFPINRNNFNRAQVESLYSGSGLFFSTSAVIFSNIFEYEETRDFILEKLGLMARSQSYFIFLENALNKPILDAFKKLKGELNVFELPKEKKEKFNSFLLANAFGIKDKLNLWIYFRQAVNRGGGDGRARRRPILESERYAHKKGFSYISEAELKNLASKLSYLLPEARGAGLDAEIAFEQFLLEVL